MKSIKILIFLYITIVLVSCDKQASDNPSSTVITDGAGVGGSTARFAIIGNTLYTVDDKSLNVFDISDTKNPLKTGRSYIGRNIETIFPRDTKTIFIGSQNGMYVYNISDPNLITEQAVVNHFRSCDPVVANDKFAFVTLNNEGTSFSRRCWGSSNMLLTYDISNINNVIPLSTYNLVHPKGLGLIGNNLFVCDNVLRWYDATDPKNLISKKNFLISAHDIIPLSNRLILVGDDGISQLGFGSDSVWFLSKIQTPIK